MATDARFRDTLKSFLAALGSAEPRRRQQTRRTIRETLAVNQKSWNDLLAALQFRGQHSDKLKKLFAMLGQDNDGEFDNARQKISDLLARERRTWKSLSIRCFPRHQRRGSIGTIIGRPIRPSILSTSCTICCVAISR
jgi:hypothetical protein